MAPELEYFLGNVKPGTRFRLPREYPGWTFEVELTEVEEGDIVVGYHVKVTGPNTDHLRTADTWFGAAGNYQAGDVEILPDNSAKGGS